MGQCGCGSWPKIGLPRAFKTLDFHHSPEHLQAVAKALHGAETPEAQAWLEKLLHLLRHSQEALVVRRLQDLLQNSPARPAEMNAVREREVNYFVSHRENLHHQAMEQAGTPLASGACGVAGQITPETPPGLRSILDARWPHASVAHERTGQKQRRSPPLELKSTNNSRTPGSGKTPGFLACQRLFKKIA